jgi:glutaredoxin
MEWLKNLVRRRRPVPIRVTLYTRPGCHLCEDAHRLLMEQRPRFHLVLECINVDEQVELTARYGECVPVVVVNGTERFRGRVNAALLTRLLSRS